MEEPPTKKLKCDEHTVDPPKINGKVGTNSTESSEHTVSGQQGNIPSLKKSEVVISESISEVDAGIVEFLGDHKGFSGTLKERWEDFIVNEIDLNGKEIHLTSYDLPEVKDDKKDFVVPSILTDSIKEMIERLITGTSDLEKFEATSDKGQRKQLHSTIKYLYPKICSNTESNEGKSYITLKKNKGGGRTDKRDKPRLGKFCQFVLYKEGKDTNAVLNIVSRKVGINTNLFATAGTKDRRAITSQLVSIKGMDAARLKGVNKTLRNIRMGNFEYTDVPLKLGSLKGNRFTLVIREAVASPKEVENSMDQLQTNGFINYFGMQRFGNSSIPTYEIGIALIKSNWEKAIDLILQPSSADFPYVRNCKETYQKTGNAEVCAAELPSESIEKKLLLGIVSHGKTLNAIEKLPRNLRLLYVHSFQSLLWNQIASRRIKEFGKKPVVGDLMLKPDRMPIHEDSTNVPAELVTPENIDMVTLSDVVIPLPGYDTIYPGCLYMPWFKESLASFGLDMSCFNHRVKDFSLSGNHRPLIVVPTNVSYELKHYSDPLEPLILTDFQLLENGDSKRTTVINDGPNLAVILKMTLDKSVYATMAIREALKQVTVKQ